MRTGGGLRAESRHTALMQERSPPNEYRIRLRSACQTLPRISFSSSPRGCSTASFNAASLGPSPCVLRAAACGQHLELEVRVAAAEGSRVVVRDKNVSKSAHKMEGPLIPDCGIRPPSRRACSLFFATNCHHHPTGLSRNYFLCLTLPQ